MGSYLLQRLGQRIPMWLCQMVQTITLLGGVEVVDLSRVIIQAHTQSAIQEVKVEVVQATDFQHLQLHTILLQPQHHAVLVLHLVFVVLYQHSQETHAAVEAEGVGMVVWVDWGAMDWSC